MRRQTITPRPDWRRKVEEKGLVFNTNPDGTPYWDESAYYLFSRREVLDLEKATSDLYEMCLKAGQHVIDRGLFKQFSIPPPMVPLICRSWDEEPPSVYGRFDLLYDGSGAPKLLEFNADTPTSLLEAAVTQWFWLQDVDRRADQFNSIHERLVAKWKELKGYMKGKVLHIASVESVEDEITCAYMADCADQAGIKTRFLYVHDIGWHEGRQVFTGPDEQPITDLFKLYPWEWLSTETFAAKIPVVERKMHWIEPAWKMLWSNKALLAVLYELFPQSPYLLPAYLDGPREMGSYVKKPLLSREGANISIVVDGWKYKESEGTYGEGPFVYQEYREPPEFHERRPVIGSWLIDGVSAGMGIRESGDVITTNQSRFVPHMFR